MIDEVHTEFYCCLVIILCCLVSHLFVIVLLNDHLIIIIDQIRKSLVEITKDIEGAKVEDNRFCVSVHYRNVEEKVRNVLCQKM